MNLTELLAHCNEVLDNSSDLSEGDADELFSDDLIVRHLNQAMRILCRRAWVIIEDGVAPAGIIVLKTDVPAYDLHESVLRVYHATPAGQDAPLGRYDDMALRSIQPDMDATYDLNDTSTAATGAQLGFATDAGTRRIRFYRTPSSTENGTKVALKVARLPINWLSLDSTEAEPETPRDWDMDLADYAIGRCLMGPNLDTQSKADGREMIVTFNEAVAEARRDRQRAEMTSAPWNFNTTTSVL